MTTSLGAVDFALTERLVRRLTSEPRIQAAVLASLDAMSHPESLLRVTCKDIKELETVTIFVERFLRDRKACKAVEKLPPPRPGLIFELNNGSGIEMVLE